MGLDECYKPKPRSNQTELPGLGAKGEATYNKAREWIKNNPSAYRYMKYQAIRLAGRKKYVSANYLVNMVRNELSVQVPNSCAPAFSRILEEEVPTLKGKFRKHASQVDGFC